MAGAPAGQGAQPPMMANIVLLAAFFAIFYFLLIRPQQKRAKEHKLMLSNLKRGDEVVTAGGVHGRIVETADDHLVVDLGETKVKLSRSAVSALVGTSRAVVEKKSKKEGKESGSSEDK